MTNSSFITAIVAAAFAVTATSSLASGDHSGGQDHRMTFQQLDKDGDGQISKEEMRAPADERFSDADTDGDGNLSRAELETQASKRMMDRLDAMMERLDKDGDNALSQEEMPMMNRSTKMFDKADKDDSGSVSEEEFDEARGKLMDRMKDRMKKHAGKDHKG